MEQVIILIIAAVAMGLQGLFKKLKGGEEDTNTAPPPPRGMPPVDPAQLTEADRRYREVQEEVRRRIAQRQQMGQPPPRPPAPVADYQPSPRSTSPIPQPMSRPTVRRMAPSSTTTATAPAPRRMPPPMPAAPIAASSEPDMDAAATEAAAYAAPEEIGALAAPAPPPAGSLRGMLRTPSSLQQAFVLRELLDKPLALRPAARGGHEAWL